MLDGSGAGGNRTPLPIGPWRGRWGLTGDYQQALGPMQFLPDTFARFASTPAADPHNINDAARAAAAYLCDGGITDIGEAIRRYNNSQSYVDEVLHWAALYQRTGGIPSADARHPGREPARSPHRGGPRRPRRWHRRSPPRAAPLRPGRRLRARHPQLPHRPPPLQGAPRRIEHRTELRYQQPLGRPSRRHHGHRPSRPTGPMPSPPATPALEPSPRPWLSCPSTIPYAPTKSAPPGPPTTTITATSAIASTGTVRFFV